ncbi:glycosyltransferase family 4 protein [Marinococcus sp. PL1-022]|uniref:glycosyltransferase family 4 protein n=1 Tax=Marinococcus sp. PL1-022 TaxID=3095363 RepID=UPI0029C39115|nr:glycosyltransferase family 4 protein [Marinococcus sp. PL1-022]MDX6154002.1 glycosyltransferase family 4 protein [Marinococcus sp. PL1-022]
MRPKAALVGQFPPPVHGLSKALFKIADAKELQADYEMQMINLTNNKRIFSTVRRLITSNCDFFYFTIAHSKGGNARDLLLLAIMLGKRRPVIIHYHGGYFKQLLSKMNPLQRKLNERLLPKAACVVVLSESLKALFQPIIPDDKLVICENFVEKEALLTEEELETKIQTMNGKHVLFLSNFIASKGYLDVLKAASLSKNHPEMTFHFAGAFFDPKEEKRFQAMVKEHELTNVVLHGVVGGEAKKDLLRTCNVFILPTYYPNEGQPISVIEAMANGLSVVTTKHAGIPDIVKEENGYFVPKQAPHAIARLLQDISVRDLQKTARVNRTYALRSFKETDYTERIHRIFQRALPAEASPEAAESSAKEKLG